jgi:predicted nuclease of predicted toxin-antitoxin system
LGKPKFIADADLNQELIRGMRRNEAAVDFLTATDGGTRGLADRQVLELAIAAGRVVVSHDRNTMTRDFYRLIKEGHSSPGLIVIDQDLDEGRAIEDLLLIWEASSEEDLRDLINWIPI